MKAQARLNEISRRGFLAATAKAGVAVTLAANSMPIFAANKREGDFKKVAGSAYPAIDTAIPGVQVCEHLSGCARILDRFVLLRTVNHDVIDEHAAATNRLHTGRPTSGTVI